MVTLGVPYADDGWRHLFQVNTNVPALEHAYYYLLIQRAKVEARRMVREQWLRLIVEDSEKTWRSDAAVYHRDIVLCSHAVAGSTTRPSQTLAIGKNSSIVPSANKRKCKERWNFSGRCRQTFPPRSPRVQLRNTTYNDVAQLLGSASKPSFFNDSVLMLGNADHWHGSAKMYSEPSTAVRASSCSCGNPSEPSMSASLFDSTGSFCHKP